MLTVHASTGGCDGRSNSLGWRSGTALFNWKYHWYFFVGAPRFLRTISDLLARARKKCRASGSASFVPQDGDFYWHLMNFWLFYINVVSFCLFDHRQCRVTNDDIREHCVINRTIRDFLQVLVWNFTVTRQLSCHGEVSYQNLTISNTPQMYYWFITNSVIGDTTLTVAKFRKPINIC